MHAIYLIRNTANGKFYVGSAVDVNKRLSQHKRCLRRNAHQNRKLQSAWNKHGETAFTFTVIEEVTDSAALLQREQFWIDTMCAVRFGYNLTPTAGSPLGTRHSDETKRRMSLAHSGKKKTPEHVENVRAALAGRKMTDEQRQKMRDKKLGVKRGPYSAEHRAKISLALTGKEISLESRAKMSLAKIGKKHSPEVRARRGKAISAAYWTKKALSETDTANNAPA